MPDDEQSERNPGIVIVLYCRQNNLQLALTSYLLKEIRLYVINL
jgi:hypothetical protein